MTTGAERVALVAGLGAGALFLYRWADGQAGRRRAVALLGFGGRSGARSRARCRAGPLARARWQIRAAQGESPGTARAEGPGGRLDRRPLGRRGWALRKAGSAAPGAASAGHLRRAVVAACAGAGAAAVLGGGAGVVAGALLAVGLYRRLSGARSPVERRFAWEEEQLARQLPFTAELLAACLGSAASPATAVAAVGRSVGAPMGPRLVTIAAELALGAPPELCWNRLGEEHPALAPLARCLVRTSLSGAPATGQLIGLAQACRSAAVRAAHTRVRRAGVLATAPLGLCFLPAFVLISVVPVVMGLTAGFARSI